MRFKSVEEAQAWSREHFKRIFTQVEGMSGVWQIYPAGRKTYVLPEDQDFAMQMAALTLDHEYQDAERVLMEMEAKKAAEAGEAGSQAT